MKNPQTKHVADFSSRIRQETDLGLPFLPPANWSVARYLMCAVFHRSWSAVTLPITARGAHCNACNRTFWWHAPARSLKERAGRFIQVFTRKCL